MSQIVFWYHQLSIYGMREMITLIVKLTIMPNDDWEDLRKLRSISLPSSALISSKFF